MYYLASREVSFPGAIVSNQSMPSTVLRFVSAALLVFNELAIVVLADLQPTEVLDLREHVKQRGIKAFQGRLHHQEIPLFPRRLEAESPFEHAPQS